MYRALLYLRHGEGTALDLAQQIADALSNAFEELSMAQNDLTQTTAAIQADVNALRGMYQQMLERLNAQSTMLDQLERTRASLAAQLSNFTQANPNTALINEQNALTGIREQLDQLRADTQQALAGTPNTPAPTPPTVTPTLHTLGANPAELEPTKNPPPPPPPSADNPPQAEPTPQPAPADNTGTVEPPPTPAPTAEPQPNP